MPAGMAPYDQTPLGNDMPSSLPPFNNRIDYGDMMKSQVVSQFQQMMANQTGNMNYNQMSAMAYNNKFQYGIENSQAWRQYQRQAEMSRVSYAGALTSGLSEMALMGATMGLGGGLAGLAFSALAPIIPMHFVNEGVQRTIQRQRMQQSIAGDLDDYRERIGLPNLSYSQSSSLASNVVSSMNTRGQFFNPSQQEGLFKTFMANDMLSAAKRGQTIGDTKQFEKNVKELFDVTETIVKTLNTTAEGGAALIKDLQMKGFGTVGQIKQTVLNAKAFGAMSGIGAQNIMQLGAAGAQATQGTPWTSQAGVSMYQAGGAMAGYMARGGNYQTQQTIAMAGGVAQAGAAIAQTQMNTLQSNMGSWAVAYAMNAKGEIDQTRLARLQTGGVSAYEMTTVGSQNYNSMGISGRALFQRNKQTVLNEFAKSPELMAKAAMGLFDAWGGWRGGNVEAKAQVFAQEFAGGMGQNYVNLYADWLSKPQAFGLMANEISVAQGIANQGLAPESDIHKRLRAAKYQAFGGLIDIGMTGTNAINAAIETGQYGLGRIERNFELGIKGGINRYAKGTFLDPRGVGIFNTGNVGNLERGYRNFYNVDARSTAQSREAYGDLTVAERQQMWKQPAAVKGLDINYEGAVRGMTREQLQYVTQNLVTGMGNQRSNEIWKDTRMFQYLGMNASQQAAAMADPFGAARAVLPALNQAVQSIGKKNESELSDYDKFVKATSITRMQQNQANIRASGVFDPNTIKGFDDLIAKRDSMVKDGKTVEQADVAMINSPNGQLFSNAMAYRRRANTASNAEITIPGLDQAAQQATFGAVDVQSDIKAANKAAEKYYGVKQMKAPGLKTLFTDLLGKKGHRNFWSDLKDEFSYGIERNSYKNKASTLAGLYNVKGAGPAEVMRNIADRVATGDFSWSSSEGSRLVDKTVEAIGVGNIPGAVEKKYETYMTPSGQTGYRETGAKETRLANQTAVANWIATAAGDKQLQSGLVTQEKLAIAGSIALLTKNLDEKSDPKGGVKDELKHFLAMDTDKKGPLSAAAYKQIESQYKMSPGQAATLDRAGNLRSAILEQSANVNKQAVEAAMRAALAKPGNNIDTSLFNNVNGVALDENGNPVAAGYYRDKKQLAMALDKLKPISASAGLLDSSRGKTLTASVNPPVLNYWNNSWAL